VIGKEDALLVVKQFGDDKFAVVLQRAITPAAGGQEHKHPNRKEMFYHGKTLTPVARVAETKVTKESWSNSMAHR
jgi:hypothetical protein